MATLSTELIILFFVLLTAIFLWRFLRDGEAKSISSAGLASSWKVLVAVVVPILLLILGGQLAGLSLTLVSSAPYFAAAVILPWLLHGLGFKPLYRSLLLLGVAVVFTLLAPAADFKIPLISAISGLAVWKAVENIWLNEESTLEDVVPPLVWLASVYWTLSVDTGAFIAIHQKFFLSAIIVTLFIKWVQAPSLKVDKLYVKRIALAATGAMLLLCMVTKVIVVPELAKVCTISGAGLFLAYVLDELEKTAEEGNYAMECFKQLLFIGIFTLLASRLFGILGILLLAISTIIATTSSIVCIAALFWIARALVQCFVGEFNSNITGINLMHTYVSAALYGGFLLAVTLSVMLKTVVSPTNRALLFASACVIAPFAVNFFLHAEPAGSMLIASGVGCVLLAVFAHGLYGRKVEAHDNIMLAPVILTSVGILTGEVINIGNTADIQQKLIAIGVLAVLSSALVVIALSVRKKLNGAQSSESPA